jgi:integrase
MPFKSKKTDRVVRYQTKDGEIRVYRYPRKKQKPQPAQRYEPDSVEALIRAFKASPEWRKLSPATQAAYAHRLWPLNGISHLRVNELTRRDILLTRDALAQARGDGAALSFVRAVTVLYGWALDREWVDINPCSQLTRGLETHHSPAWTQQQADKALQELPAALRKVVLLAMHTGQRRGDLCALVWSAYDGRTIRVKPRKTARKTERELVIPVPGLVGELDSWKASATSTCILTDRFGKPWKPNVLSKVMQYHLGLIGLPAGLNVHGLRKLAAARLAECGCSEKEIMSITGHRTMRMVALYTDSANQKTLAEAAVIRLEKRFGQNRTKRA